MTQETTAAPEGVRDYVISNPDHILEDADVMAALVGADDTRKGGNVVDLRGMAMQRLEDRLAKLEETHQTVLSVAYDNVATTQQVHRAILAMVAPLEMTPFLRCLSSDVADILRVTAVRVLMEPAADGTQANIHDPQGVIAHVKPGSVARYLDTWTTGRSRDVVLRRLVPGQAPIYPVEAGPIRSEALLRLELGAACPVGLLALGAASRDQYQAAHATDLFELFGRVFERTLRGMMP